MLVRKRRVRLSLYGAEPEVADLRIEGLLVGRWGRHYKIESPVLLRGAEAFPLAGYALVPKRRVQHMERVPPPKRVVA